MRASKEIPSRWGVATTYKLVIKLEWKEITWRHTHRDLQLDIHTQAQAVLGTRGNPISQSSEALTDTLEKGGHLGRVLPPSLRVTGKQRLLHFRRDGGAFHWKEAPSRGKSIRAPVGSSALFLEARGRRSNTRKSTPISYMLFISQMGPCF